MATHKTKGVPIMSRKLLLIVFLLVLTTFTACSNPPSATPSPESGNGSKDTDSVDAGSASDQSNYLWQLTLVSAETADNLANTQTFILYGGSTEDVQYAKSASEGCTFLLLELNINKNGVGGHPFSWSDVYIEDEDGNTYNRMENDVFLEDYDLPRLKSTDLTIGNNSGYICFEIPADTDVSSLKLVHEAEEGPNLLPIAIIKK